MCVRNHTNFFILKAVAMNSAIKREIVEELLRIGLAGDFNLTQSLIGIDLKSGETGTESDEQCEDGELSVSTLQNFKTCCGENRARFLACFTIPRAEKYNFFGPGEIKKFSQWKVLLVNIFENLLSPKIQAIPNLWGSNFDLFVKYNATQENTVRFLLTYLQAIVLTSKTLETEIAQKLAADFHEARLYFESYRKLRKLKVAFQQKDSVLRENFPELEAFSVISAKRTKRRKIVTDDDESLD